MIIGITGRSGAGKDSVATQLAKFGYTQQRISDPVKWLACEQFGLDYNKINDFEYKEGPLGFGDKTVRFALQEIAMAFRRIDPDHWIRTALDRAAMEDGDVCLSDVRFVDEARLIRDRGGVVWKVVKIGGDVSAGDAHETEREIDAISADFTLQAEAGDMAELRRQVELSLSLMDGNFI